jgi:hypothetical protein
MNTEEFITREYQMDWRDFQLTQSRRGFLQHSVAGLGTLAELEQDLGEATFVRIHRSIIVNLERIQGLELQSGGEYEVVLKSEIRLRLSRRFRKRLQERMEASVSR